MKKTPNPNMAATIPTPVLITVIMKVRAETCINRAR